ncbi:IclR family transcriptional regulator [Nocardioides sp. CFH 31398]|uniref:IclR family transcriptional regulator n=1 Tax=Nocardioides sp. CFH 31398 TaxID=2919579 RepID=UPI001F067E1F|nr:IclR family transcriptional regulator [Nocardioides sp. CFH 31398]MCH1865507.1 IclR family transcriptional regulator [Nocardioides sp. CFH 31398]
MTKALDVLAAFEGSRPSLTLTELSRHADLPLSTTHRLVGDLVRTEFLRREPDGRFRPGRRAWKIGQNAGRALQEAVRPRLVELHRRTGHAAQLAIRDGGHALVIDGVHGSAARPGTSSRPGARLPLHTCATGKALLAHEESWIREGYLSGSLERSTPSTQADATALAAQLEQVRRRGWATTVEEARLGTAALAVPVVVGSGVAVAAVGLVAGATEARRLVDHVPTLREVAASIALEAPRWPNVRAVIDTFAADSA